MKRIFAFAVALLLCATMFAKPVTQQTAREVAVNFWSTTDRGLATLQIPDFHEISTELGLSGFYVFNTPENDGFVLVSADDAMSPVLGYSTSTGMVGRSAMPDNVKSWLGHYTEEYEAAVANGWQATETVAAEWADLIAGTNQPKAPGTKAVNALIQTQWDQDEPFNNLCPMQGGSRSVTGCVATAMAQVMKYWEWPTTGTGSHSYTSESYSLNVSVNFASTTYQWSSMPNGGQINTYPYYEQLTWNNTQKTAVATLMYHCGASVDMDYSSGDYGSGAYAEDIPNALLTYFGYAPGITMRYKDNYTDANWISMLKAELDAGRPMLYGGASSGGGHSFVCDGYDASNRFHFNFGWSGSSDGFFLLTSITPGTGGIGGGTYDFTYYQDAIFGISSPNGNPLDPSELPTDIATYSPFTISSTVAYGSTLTGQCDFINTGSATFNGKVGVAAYRNGAFVALLMQSANVSWPQGYGPASAYSISATIASPFTNGTYTAKAVYSTDGGQTWLPITTGYNGCPISNDFTVTGAPSATNYTITVNSANTAMGTVSGGGTYAQGTTATLRADAKTGYRFVRWNDNNTQNPRNVVVSGNATYTAYFAANGTNAIDEVSNAPLRIYPNPTNGLLNIDVDGNCTVEVIDAIGRVLVSQSDSKTVDMSRLDAGVYTVRVTAGGNTVVRKVAKQ